MIGYLCCYGPFQNAFKTTNDVGIYAPVHGHGIIECNHKNIFALLYQEAAEKWIDAGITNHAITIYANNNSIKNQLYRYGFGLRCVDAIRPMSTIDEKTCKDISVTELEHNEFHLIYPLGIHLSRHLWNSPMFLRYKERPEEEKDGDPEKFAQWQINENFRYFAAKIKGKIVAYIKITDEGENFISDSEFMKNICGAYCYPEFRGQGIMENILNYLIEVLKNENYTLLGTDYESYNPTADGFWLKYFAEYTHSVVRRVDDRYIKHPAPSV
jgi:GNAT superfamily N-acetyltransferase